MENSVSGTSLNIQKIVARMWNNISNGGERLNRWESKSDPEAGGPGGAELRSEATQRVTLLTAPHWDFHIGLLRRSVCTQILHDLGLINFNKEYGDPIILRSKVR